MKTSSLEGSLSCMNNENAGLQIENVEIRKNLEITEQNLNEYVQKNQGEFKRFYNPYLRTHISMVCVKSWKILFFYDFLFFRLDLSLAVDELQDTKRDLNETCLILETRMGEAEQAREVFKQEAEAAK